MIDVEYSDFCIGISNGSVIYRFPEILVAVLFDVINDNFDCKLLMTVS